MKNIPIKSAYYLKLIFVGTVIVCQSQKSIGQLLTNDNAAITISSGTQVTVQGDVQNQNGASVTNNGTIDLNGNWINNAANDVFGTSAGTVIMNGANQTIGGSDPTLFNNLTMQGSDTKTLLVNTSAGGNSGTGILDIGSSNLVLNSQSLTVTNASAVAINFTTGFITSEQTDNSSKVIWNINSTAGSHTIPFGNMGGVQIPFTYDLSSGIAGALTVSTYATAPDNAPFPVIPDAVTHVRNNQGIDNSPNTVDRFWQVDVSGTPAAAMTFTWAVTENAANGNINPQGQRWNSPLESWETPVTGQINPTAQSVTIPNVTVYGPWAVALSASPLPVELLSFDAIAVDNKIVQCKWITASEINNDFFTVERSKDGNEFEEAGIVDGAGNSTNVLNYSFADITPYNGTSYYRLKQTDFNGTFSYSNIVTVNIVKAGSSEFIVFPNPAYNQFTAEFSSEEDKEIELELFDVAGRKVFTEKIAVTKGINSQKIDISNLLKGVYLIEAVSGEKKNVKRLIKK